MEQLELTDDLLTGIKEINNQHRQLFAKGNALMFPETESCGAVKLMMAWNFLSSMWINIFQLKRS